MTQGQDEQRHGLNDVEQEAKATRERLAMAYHYMSSFPRTLTDQGMANMEALRAKAGIDRPALPHGILAVLDRYGLTGPRVPPVAPAVMPQMASPAMPSQPPDVPPTPTVSWDFAEHEHAPAGIAFDTTTCLPEPHQTAETVAERNARWLTVFDAMAKHKLRGAQTRAIRQIAARELVTESTVKRGIQDAGKVRDQAVNGNKGHAPKATKHSAAAPFGHMLSKGKTSP